MRKFIFTLLFSIGCVFCNYATDLQFAKTSIPYEGEHYSSLSELVFTFDLQNIDTGSYSFDQTGLEATMTQYNYITLYKGNGTNGEQVFTFCKYISIEDPGYTGGITTLSFALDKEYILEANQEYTLHIPNDIFYFTSTDGKYADFATLPETEIHFYGAETSANDLVWESCDPESGSSLNDLTNIVLNFNSDIEVVNNAEATLYDGAVIVEKAPLSVSSNSPKEVVVSFDKETLYVSHEYTVVIPENAIVAKGDSKGYREIQLTYEGASYKYYSYGRIAPADNSEVSYLGTVTIPLIFDNGYNLGRSKAPKAYLYEGDGTEPISTFDCGSGDDARSWTIPVWNFELNPSAEYRIVIPADQVSPWETTETGGLREVKDTSNPELVLNYTTPAVIEPLPRQSFKSVASGVTEPVKNLTSLRVDFEPYFFEDVFYYPVFPTTLTEGYNLVRFVDVTTGDESNFPVEIKWDEANNYWLENSGEINYTLLKDHDYQVVIPAGMFRCRLEELGDNSANEEYAINFKGATRTEFDVTLILAEVGSLKSVVAAGKTLSVDLTGTEDWKVSAVLFNGEAVETEGNTYTTPAIEEDATIEVEYEYAREIDYNFTSGVDMTEICPYGVVSEGGNLVITGVQSGDSIVIYTAGGLKVAELPAVPQGMDIVTVALPEGQAYIILINGKSLKVMHQN